MNIGRKRYSSGFVQNFFPNTFKIKSDNTVSTLKNLFAFSFELSWNEGHFLAFTNFLTRTGQCFPVIIVDSLKKKELDRTLGVAPDAKEPCGYNSGVVDDKNVAFAKVIGKIVEMTVPRLMADSSVIE